MPFCYPNGIFPNDDWTLCEGNADGLPFVVRMGSTLPSVPDQELFAPLFIITWPYPGNESGMPEKEEHLRMQAFEDALESGTERRMVAFQALSLTGGNKKEGATTLPTPKPSWNP